MKRSLYVGVAVLLAAIAAVLTLRAQHTVPVVVATHDLRAGTAVTADDVQVISVHEESLPAGALSSTDAAVGSYVAWPLTAGEPILSRALSQQSTGSTVTAGYTVPKGFRAIAVPVGPAAAVGGMLSPGDRVDVYATPNGQHQASSVVVPVDPSSDTSSTTTLLDHDLLVLQLRSDQGQALVSSTDSTVHGLNFGSGKLGSVVVAVPSHDVTKFAAAAADETLYLALTVS